MDVNGYTNPRIVSPADLATRPEILAEAMAGTDRDECLCRHHDAFHVHDAVRAAAPGRRGSARPQPDHAGPGHGRSDYLVSPGVEKRGWQPRTLDIT